MNQANAARKRCCHGNNRERKRERQRAGRRLGKRAENRMIVKRLLCESRRKGWEEREDEDGGRKGG